MRMLMHVTFPHERFNAAVKDGTIESKMERIIEELKPEATYYTATRGHRSAYMIVDMQDPSQIPHFAEPWFLLFNADCEFHPVMVPEDLGRAGLSDLGKTWA